MKRSWAGARHGCRCIVLGTTLLCLCGGWAGGTEPPSVENLAQQFTPRTGTLQFSYEVVYRFLFMTLARIATAHVEAQEGIWSNQVTGALSPAFFVRANMDTYDTTNNRARVSLHDRMAVVFSLPELQTLVYLRSADQVFNPLMSTPKSNHHVELFDFQGGPLRYRRHDFLSGEILTHLPQQDERMPPGQEVANLLRLLGGKWPDPGEKGGDPDQVWVELCGKPREFKVRTAHERVAVAGKKRQTLRAEIRGAYAKDGYMFLWMVPLPEASQAYALAAPPPFQPAEWQMIPVLADYGLMLGYMRCRLVNLSYVETNGAINE